MPIFLFRQSTECIFHNEYGRPMKKNTKRLSTGTAAFLYDRSPPKHLSSQHKSQRIIVPNRLRAPLRQKHIVWGIPWLFRDTLRMPLLYQAARQTICIRIYPASNRHGIHIPVLRVPSARLLENDPFVFHRSHMLRKPESFAIR